MFGSKKTKKTQNMSTENFSANTIQNGTSIKGHVDSEGSIRIDGRLEGSLNTNAKLVIGKSGVIIGDIFCQNASVEGEIEGQITVQGLLDLKSSGSITGDIVTNKLVVEEGAAFNGKIEMGKSTKNKSIGEKDKFPQKEAV